MSFGDHLEELRNCLIRALVGFFVGAVFSFGFGKEILGIVCLPLLRAQAAAGLTPNLQVLAPTAAFTAYLKIGLLSGLIVSMPWVLAQIWRFVASGLYTHERRFVRMLVPSSMGLFVLGVLFLYFVVLPIILGFFIRFNQSFGSFDLPVPVSLVSPQTTPPDTEISPGPPRLPVLMEAPIDAEPGDMWYDRTTNRLMLQTESGVRSSFLEPGATSATMQSQFAIDYYVSFVLVLALAFGIAFETPIVVLFLAWSRLVSTSTMARGRRYVLLGTIVVAAILTPPDVISQLLLAIPIYLLFELGILIARTTERKKPEAEAAT